MAASDDSESLVLDGLEAAPNEALLNNRTPNPSSIRKRRSDKRLESVQEKAAFTTPVRRGH